MARMSTLGDLGGGLLGLLYDLRLAVAIASCALVVALLLAARRYGWAGRVRRHPIAAGSAAVVGLVLVAPLAWYLVSPIFIRTELVEPPLADAAVAARPTSGDPGSAGTDVASAPPGRPSASPATESPSVGATAQATAAPWTATPWTATPPRSGTFHGTDDFHFGRGTATLSETAPGEWVIRLDDFSVRNGPDLYVYLSPAPRAYADGAIEVAQLKATDGSFNVPLPDGVHPAGSGSVLIWCKQFSHLFAYATLRS